MSDCRFVKEVTGKIFDCCGSCHEDWQCGFDYEITINAPWDKIGEHDLWVCCTCPKLTEEDWIKIYKIKGWEIEKREVFAIDKRYLDDIRGD